MLLPRRDDEAMRALILGVADADPRIRAVLLNGSHANPNVAPDPLQDWDIVYAVTEIGSFVDDAAWPDRFGPRIVMQLPEAMADPAPSGDGHFAYLMQLADGHRIDLTLMPLERLDGHRHDSLTIVLLDKDGRIPPLPPPSERDYWPTPPTAKAFDDCCNEFWWVSPYVAKALRRGEILHARHLLDGPLRDQLMRVLTWQFGAATGFSRNPGKYGKRFRETMTDDDWRRLRATYADADPERTAASFDAMRALFRKAAREIAARFDLTYPHEDDSRVSAFLAHLLPRVTLREVGASDLDTLFAHQLDPDANRMAAFVHEDPTDRAAFDAHWRRILNAPGIVNRTIVADGQIAGHVACFPADDGLEVTYWLGRAFWGRGIATRALAALLREIDDRPIFGRAASDNVGSIRVLQKCGFVVVGHDTGFAHGRGAETEEVILRLDVRV